ncbi:hypothetical protein TNCV_1760171, partial [Trichonephila clavipes]
ETVEVARIACCGCRRFEIERSSMDLRNATSAFTFSGISSDDISILGFGLRTPDAETPLPTLWINWLSSPIRFSDVVGASSTICAATTVPPPSQSSSCSVQPTMDSLVRQIQQLSLQVAELTKRHNSSRHQRYSSDRRRSPFTL